MSKPLTIGSHIPTFEGKDAAGHLISSNELLGKPFVLYFYPKDDTPGCTQQACQLRDTKPLFDHLQVMVIGVSPDSEKSHTQFIDKYNLNFLLLSDPEHTIADAFHVWQQKKMYGRTYNGVLRTTFIVDATGIIRWMESPVEVNGHAERVLHALKELNLAVVP